MRSLKAQPRDEDQCEQAHNPSHKSVVIGFKAVITALIRAFMLREHVPQSSLVLADFNIKINPTHKSEISLVRKVFHRVDISYCKSKHCLVVSPICRKYVRYTPILRHTVLRQQDVAEDHSALLGTDNEQQQLGRRSQIVKGIESQVQINTFSKQEAHPEQKYSGVKVLKTMHQYRIKRYGAQPKYDFYKHSRKNRLFNILVYFEQQSFFMTA